MLEIYAPNYLSFSLILLMNTKRSDLAYEGGHGASVR